MDEYARSVGVRVSAVTRTPPPSDSPRMATMPLPALPAAHGVTAADQFTSRGNYDLTIAANEGAHRGESVSDYLRMGDIDRYDLK